MKTPFKSNHPDLFIGPAPVSEKQLRKADAIVRTLKKQKRTTQPPLA